MAPSRKNKPQAQPSTSSFNEAALSKLTAKIDRNLTGKPSDRSHRGKRKRLQPAEDVESGPKKKQAHSGDHRSKRDKPGPAQPVEGRGKKEALLEEIKALGGDEADLDLVAGIDSDAEEGAEKTIERPLDNGFTAELAKYASSLGFEKVRGEALEASDSDSDGESEDDAEGNGDSEGGDNVVPQVSRPAPAANVERPRKSGKLVFDPRPDWHAVDQAQLPPPSADDIRNFSAVIASLKSYASGLLEADASEYKATVASSSTHRFMSTIMSSGTMSDKVSALTLEIQESPVHNTRAFENLLGLAGKKNRGQAMAALAALVDLLANGVVLPSDRRLRPFQSQPGLLGALQSQPKTSWTSGQKLPGKVTPSHLIMWQFEDWLKDAFFKVIQLLEVWSNDEIEYSRSRSLDFVFNLLKDKPEQEANLLRLLVNKLGDRERKIASRALYLILQLLNVHPGMKAIVIHAVEQEILLRPGQAQRAKYYAINTLNQTILSSKEPSVADTLVRIYFELFLSMLKSGALGAVDLPGADNLAKEEPDGGKSRGRRRRMRDDKKNSAERDTAEKLVSAILTGVNRAIPFAMTDESTLEKHLDTLFKITHSSNFNTSIQALMLIQQVAVSKYLAVERFYRTLYESLLDPRLITSSKHALYLNLLYRSLKNDVDVRRVKAFVKRMLQVVTLHQASFTCGILYLIAELGATFPDLKTLLTEPEQDDDDGEEVYKDVVEGGEVNGNGERSEPVTKRTVYDGRKRDPEYSNAQQSCLWELMPFLEHFHPSVAAFASNLLVPQASLPKPDLANHTLIHFLDKFVYRNPKSGEAKRGSSIMQPVLAAGSSAHIVASGKTGAKQQESVNSAAFWNKKVENVAAEDIFFHEYFSQIGKPGQVEKTKDAAPDGSDSEQEDEIWQALVDSRPELEGDDEGAADVDMSEDDDADLGSLLDMSDSDGEEVSDEDDGDVSPADDDLEFGEAMDEDDEAGSVDEDDQAASRKTTTKAGRLRRKELKALPTFASVDDYAAMLAEEPDEDFR